MNVRVQCSVWGQDNAGHCYSIETRKVWFKWTSTPNKTHKRSNAGLYKRSCVVTVWPSCPCFLSLMRTCRLAHKHWKPTSQSLRGSNVRTNWTWKAYSHLDSFISLMLNTACKPIVAWHIWKWLHYSDRLPSVISQRQKGLIKSLQIKGRGHILRWCTYLFLVQL